MTGRTLAIGDVHGCAMALRTLLGAIAPTQADTVVLLGDLIDRGPDTCDVLEQVLRLQSRCRVVTIRGNHEEMMLQALNGKGWPMWIACGGNKVLESYGGDSSRIPESHRDLLESTVDYWDTASAIFVHANLESDVPLDEQHTVCLRWMHLEEEKKPYDRQRRVICGHTPQSTGMPIAMPGWVCIDTDCQRGGWLTCLDVDSNHVVQTNEAGEVREFLLAPV